MASVTATIYGLSAGIASAGGWPEVAARGMIRGTNGGQATLKPVTWTGVGIAGQYISATVEVECPQRGEAEFQPGDTVTFSGSTLIFISIVNVTFNLTCAISNTKTYTSKGLVDPALGFEPLFTTTWKVD
jgi:hypothetical protein